MSELTDSEISKTVIIDFFSTDILLKAYSLSIDRPMQPDRLNTGLTKTQLQKACSFLSRIKLIKEEGVGYGDFNSYSITNEGLMASNLKYGVKEYLAKLTNIANEKSTIKDKSLILKFWLLISENQLISGMILIVITIILSRIGCNGH